MRTGSAREEKPSRSLGELITRTSEVLCLAYGLTMRGVRFATAFASGGSMVNQEGGMGMPAAFSTEVASILFRIVAPAASRAPPKLRPRPLWHFRRYRSCLTLMELKEMSCSSG